MRPKHRRAKLKKHEKKAYPNGYYEKLLWFIVSDSVESGDIDEITTRYLRAWDDIWYAKESTGKPGRPKNDESLRIRKMNALINADKSLRPTTAAKRVANSEFQLTDNQKEALVKRLVRQRKELLKKHGNIISEEKEHTPEGAIFNYQSIEMIEADSKEFWQRQEPKMLEAFLSDIKKHLKA